MQKDTPEYGVHIQKTKFNPSSPRDAADHMLRMGWCCPTWWRCLANRWGRTNVAGSSITEGQSSFWPRKEYMSRGARRNNWRTDKASQVQFSPRTFCVSMQQGGKKIVTEKKVGGPSVVVIVRSCCSPSAANIMTLTNFRSFHKRSIRLEMRFQAENIISPILDCHAAAAAEAEKPG